MVESNSIPTSKSAAIRSEFDKILMQHISGLIDTREDIAKLPFNLATIASLLLLAERENEIKSFPESPPERYNRESFFADIEEIGLELDEDLIEAIQNLEHYGFVMISPADQYKARESASLLILVLDSIFPQMPGMNLVAYVSQSIEEVTSARKEQDAALQQFDQTLAKQGVRLSAVSNTKLSSSATQRILPPEEPDPEILKERRSAYLQKLKAMRAKNLSTDGSPTVVFGSTNLKHAKIKELFPKNFPAPEPEIPSLEPAPAVSAAPPEVDQASLADAMDETPLQADAIDETVSDLPEESVSEPETPEEMELQTVPESDLGGEPAPEPPPEDDIPAEIPTSVSAPTDPSAENVDTPESEPEQLLSKEDLVEQRIKQFEEDLAMPCPICNAGKVLSDTTEKGKTYYHCSNEDCRLISWGKPYPMECPVCKNPFLIEVAEPDGQIGLKCPRATCMYRKKAAAGILAGEEDLRKKKVAVVKKKRRKGVRRVVRRKS
jgi:ssDNA-binding Zn-finger/Zn-ribbon topoisomerase 1